MKKQQVIPLLKETYLMVIKNSIGSKMFRSLYAKVDGKKTDITRRGDLSCAFYASSVLFLFGLIKKKHATVSSTIKDLKRVGWKEIKKPKIGSVLIWAEKEYENGEKYKHIGFYIGNEKAISNSPKYRYPIEHSWNRLQERKIVSILWNPELKSRIK